MKHRPSRLFVLLGLLSLMMFVLAVPPAVPMAAAQNGEDDALFDALAETREPERAELIAQEIRRQWRKSGGAAVLLLLEQAQTLEEAGDLDDAEDKLTGIVRLWPDFAEGWALRGEFRLRRGNEDGALEDLTLAARLEVRHFAAQALLGQLFETQGAWADALEAYLMAHLHYPALPGPSERIAVLRELVGGTD